MASSILPARAGIGLKSQHFRDVLESLPDIGFFEVHAENYMVDGGPLHHTLDRVRRSYPISLHGVGLSIAGEDALDGRHLDRLAALIDLYQPAAFSEHLAWSTYGGVFLNDLLPLPYDQPSLARVCARIDRTQDRLRTRMLIENPSTYVEFTASTLSETQFLTEVIRRTGCGLLLDVNNAYVSCVNHGRDPYQYVSELPLNAVGEIHLAGFKRDRDAAGAPLLIDTHGSPIDVAVWELYASVISDCGLVATLIERDNDVPSLDALIEEATRADRVLLAKRGEQRLAIAGASR